MLVDSQEKLTELMNCLGSSTKATAVDTETNITDRYNDRYCMGISLANDLGSWYIPLAHNSWMAPDAVNLPVPTHLLRPLQRELVFHNAKFDIHVLRRAGIVIPEIKIYDTMLMSHLIFEDRLQGHSLEVLAAEYLGVHKERDLAKTMKAADWDQMPAFAMAKYAEQDAKLTWELYYALKGPFEPYEEVWQTDEKFMLLLQQMEQKGILLDVNKCSELQALCAAQIDGMKSSFGYDPAKTSQLHKKLFQPPPFGLGLTVKYKTPGGKPQVNTRFLQETNHPHCGELLQYRETVKQLTSYYNSYLNLVGPNYNRIHPSFKQHGTVTGRLSCADPNMQQIPRDSPIKSLFLPEEGKQLWEIDYKNIEMRLAAVYSREPALFDTFMEEGDVHQRTADELGISRQHAKVINFLIIYGGGIPALATQLRISPEQAKIIYNKFREAYKHLFAVMRQCTEAAETTGEIRMWSGRKRHFKWKNEASKAFNAIIQGGSFEIVKRSMLILQGAGFDIRNQVHDSVWLMVNGPEDVKRAERLMEDWTVEAFELRFSVESKRLA